MTARTLEHERLTAAEPDRVRFLRTGDNARLGGRLYRVVGLHRADDGTGTWVQVEPTPPGEQDPVRWWHWSTFEW